MQYLVKIDSRDTIAMGLFAGARRSAKRRVPSRAFSEDVMMPDKAVLDLSSLFSTLEVNRLHLRNRIAMSPMTRNFTQAGLPVKGVADYYRRRAEGGRA
ncbi:hypothetical protein KRR38_14930 [Novosphingobium sp. G106]|uniref:hypothetical protein n=1 Tax=Novosphingobium sp. G106 TaxID=2849500 RepID=UPI001C2D920E|nr:hypothetical protein [Novosphingobium sp. G106]MBV1688930.1 hypothetical protein [Novosphingobium sp. G106]